MAESGTKAGHPNDAVWQAVVADMRRLADTLRAGGMPAVEKAFKVTRSPIPAARPAATPLPPPSVPPMRDNLALLREEVASFARQREQAEAKCAEVNPVVRQVGMVRMAEPGLRVVGPSVAEWHHPDNESTTYNHAAIQVPDGVGVLRFELQWGAILGEDHIQLFVPFAECEPPLQARLAPHIDGLLGELMRGLNMSVAAVG